ncbi:hypothetical protein L228DRAFT_270568 [Xylona heveae TC161]|uniref:N-glycosylation protein EOS1 n=1 Tax=Xylona heveae (strain CBS 132557 / TC161) TaxID=1328760 RepID=A0A165AHW0_XYLHT|nr:hypothetical protein L228DRAFT_270568 [Xylona heveae TC161]KZF20501.1 hypothetical protein L228DRAFT_270568 [Xylona heveae TC161]
MPDSPAKPVVSSPSPPPSAASALHPRVAVLLGVSRRWHLPLLVGRALSTAPAAWWGLRCMFTFLEEFLRDDNGAFSSSWETNSWFRITEVFLALLWCIASAYLSFFFTDSLMSRWLLNYTPSATLVRLLTISASNAYITSWVLYLSGASQDSRLLLPAWISIASTLTVLYHVTQHRSNIKRETSASIGVFSIASFISMVALLILLHLAREDNLAIPLLQLVRKLLKFIVKTLARRFNVEVTWARPRQMVS